MQAGVNAHIKAGAPVAIEFEANPSNDKHTFKTVIKAHPDHRNDNVVPFEYYFAPYVATAVSSQIFTPVKQLPTYKALKLQSPKTEVSNNNI